VFCHNGHAPTKGWFTPVWCGEKTRAAVCLHDRGAVALGDTLRLGRS
jgi:hypothetical protein